MLILETESITKKDVTYAIIKNEVIELNLGLNVIGLAGFCQDAVPEAAAFILVPIW